MANFFATFRNEVITPRLVSPFVTRDPAGTIPGSGGDYINGGGGANIMQAGGGDDTYVVDNLFDIVTEGADAGTDRSGITGVQDFVFGGTTLKTQGYLWVEASGTDTLVRGNVNGTAAPEFELRIADGAVLPSAYVAADFLR